MVLSLLHSRQGGAPGADDLLTRIELETLVPGPISAISNDPTPTSLAIPRTALTS